jgi:hypothetical protein
MAVLGEATKNRPTICRSVFIVLAFLQQQGNGLQCKEAGEIVQWEIE